MRRAYGPRSGGSIAAIALGLLLASAGMAVAARIQLKDGRILEGKLAPLISMSNKPLKPKADGSPTPKLIILCDDGLRRYYVSRYEIPNDGFLEADGDAPEKFILKNQPVVRDGGKRVTAVGPMKRISPFDDQGRRTVEMVTENKSVVIFQGISEITPTWMRVEGLRLKDATPYLWDQRLATSSLPHELLAKILANQINPKNIDQRLKIVRLYLQMERYTEARDELSKIIEDFPEHADKFSRTERELAQRSAQRMLAEIQLRGAAGQHKFASEWLANFPHEGVAGEILQKVRQAQDTYKADFARGTKIVEKIDEYLAKVGDTKLLTRLTPIRDEIVAELNFNTLERMTAFEQAIDDDAASAEEKLSIAFSGWLMGNEDAVRKLPVAASLYTVRNKVREYLEEPLKPNREAIIESLAAEEGATVEYVTRLLAVMLPTRKLPEQQTAATGFYEFDVDMPEGEAPLTYYVQLPPEYDPHRTYSTVVTLHGGNSTPTDQIDWWAGSPGPDGSRLGQAGRNGYIVIAPAWGKEQQGSYGYTLREHMAVLNTLRDACRHFAIDTDRVFLSGHSMGGDAAWDIGLAHPDLWAGVIPIVATADKYVKHYWEQMKMVPCYVIEGGLDGDKLARNSELFDKCLSRTGFNFTLVEFQGRGHEHFSDEILRLFDWMGRIKRDFARRNITGYSMRPWDNFFWWVEVAEFPPKTQVDPADWPAERGTRAATTTANVNANNGIHVTTGADRVTVWLSPEVVDFKRKLSISVNGRTVKGSRDIEPSLTVLLEDVRTRAARLHPFWAKVETPGGRVNVAATEQPTQERKPKRAVSK